MSNSIALTGSLDDIVFEGRNKSYGAFQLRQSYQRHLSSALGITVVACSLLLLLPFVVRYFSPNEAIVCNFPIVEPLHPHNYKLPDIKPLLPATPAAQRPITVTPHSTFKTHVVPDTEVKPIVESTLPPDVGKLGPATVGEPNTAGASSGSGTATIGKDSAGPAAVAAPAAVLFAEVMPDFVGGRTALQRYLQKHLRFPGAAMAAQVSGRVYVSFVVQTDGSIGEVTVLKGLGYGTEEAAARVVREMPAWTPGLQNHHAVPVRFTLPITFQYE